MPPTHKGNQGSTAGHKDQEVRQFGSKEEIKHQRDHQHSEHGEQPHNEAKKQPILDPTDDTEHPRRGYGRASMIGLRGRRRGGTAVGSPGVASLARTLVREIVR